MPQRELPLTMFIDSEISNDYLRKWIGVAQKLHDNQL